MTRLTKKVVLRGIIHAKTGLHIGAGKDRVKIGGIDNPVVRAVLKDGIPYIPGSSLKGKIRALLEQIHGVDCMGERDKGHNKDGSCLVCQVFGGVQTNNVNHGSRVIFRDAYLTTQSKQKLKTLDTPLSYTEVKAETAIDRITGKARNKTLRMNERVPAGAEFDFEIVINVFEGNNEPTEKQIRDMLIEGSKLLNLDYLGASGSRGYGQVEMKFNGCEAYEVSPTGLSRDLRTEQCWQTELQNNSLWMAFTSSAIGNSDNNNEEEICE